MGAGSRSATISTEGPQDNGEHRFHASSGPSCVVEVVRKDTAVGLTGWTRDMRWIGLTGLG
ncbi:hypothetical protein BC629DRAFT_1709539 [Irpex lacteus]|nr:hypothetical protein BC629DRAFT_1709539 [Irpex lacteus]